VPHSPRLAPHVQALLDEANKHLADGQPERAFALLREALARPDLRQAARGEVAAGLGWALLWHDPSDPVPDEAREALTVARNLAPRGQLTHPLHAFILVHDGDSAGALRCATAVLRTLPRSLGGLIAQVLCIKAAAHHDLGQDALGSKMREIAVQVWPECDLLPWLEDRTTREAPC
jgi:hypothetical protein